jgi:RNA polymerase sigma factor for flagellar operon FliA
MTTPAQTAYENAREPEDRIQALVLEHLPLVNRVVDRSFAGLQGLVPRDDMISAGMLGLVEAAHRYDESRGVKFSTFAYHRVRGAVGDLLRQADWLSKTAREQLTALRGLMREFQAANGRRPAIEELSELSGMSEEDVLQCLSYEKWDHVASMDGYVEDPDGEPNVLSSLIAADVETPEESLEWKEKVARLSAAIQSLPERQQQIIVMYYYEELYVSEIAEVLGVSQGRVSQLHTKALYNLTRLLEGE